MSTETQSNNRRLAKNTLMLYFRMLFTMAVGLYTSRVILATLGVEDYGIYNVVGGFVSMFSVISATMTTATQRFLSFEIGKGEKGRVTELFTTSVIIHILLAVIIFLFAETLGLWFLNSKMVFGEDRLIAANWVYQLSVVTFMINVISVPYNASLIAYEKMSAFAYVSIYEVTVKLLLVYLLSILPYDKLIIFAVMIAILSISIRAIYGIYVKKHFKDCYCTWRIDKEFRQQMLGFISWNFIGSVASILKEQGINVVLNLFFGAAVNAARGIVYQVLKAVSGFVSNFQLALNPQIVKHYAANEKEEMFKLVFRGSKFSYLLMMTLSLPLMIKSNYILSLWLVEVPDYTVVFLRLVLLTTLVDSLSHTLIASVHASGKVKWYQIINGSILMMTLPTVYIMLKFGSGPEMAFYVSLLFSVICLFVRMSIIHYTIGFPFMNFLSKVLTKVLLVSLLSYFLLYHINNYLSDTFVLLIILCVCSLVICSGLSFFIALELNERDYIIKIIKRKFIS